MIKNQEKSALHAIQWSEDEDLSDNSLESENFILGDTETLSQSIRMRRDTFAEWADFDEVRLYTLILHIKVMHVYIFNRRL